VGFRITEGIVMDRKQKLELTWIGKYDEIKVEPRILLEDKSKGYGDPNTENMLIHGDNLLALKALEQDFAGKIKCIYIDPPYNTGNAFEHYDDNLEHSIWLNLMYRRIIILHKLLKEDGVLLINIDETQHAYLKVMIDEIFGRKNFIGDIIWKKRKGGGNDSRFIALDHDYILVYAKNSSKDIHKQNPRSQYIPSSHSNSHKASSSSS
jgi:adenine-specific DNA-methyltransferase